MTSAGGPVGQTHLRLPAAATRGFCPITALAPKVRRLRAPRGLLGHSRTLRVGGTLTRWPDRALRVRRRSMLAEPSRQGFQIRLSSTAEQIRELPRIDRRKRTRLGQRRQPTPQGASQQTKDDARVPHFTSDAEASLGAIGETGEPGPIFCRLPVITRSFSARPVTLTESPSVGPSVTIFCSALLSGPTT
jgi:hypothetical protein